MMGMIGTITRRLRRNRDKPYSILTDSQKICVVIVDMQEYFLEKLAYDERCFIIGNQKKVLRWCAEKDIPVIALEYRCRGKTIKELSDSFYVINRVESIIKSDDNGFSWTRLNRLLYVWGVEELFLMGINASACVKRTARGAVRRRYRIVTSLNLIADPSSYEESKSGCWYKQNGILLDDHLKDIGL
ncbi:isochorismatase family protein [Patescibacteria group bacterium]